MPKRRQYTRELLTARAESLDAYREGRGPLLRIVADWGASAYPVAHEPRNASDPRPWVMYDAETGAEWFRFSGRECYAVAVDDIGDDVPTQSVARSVVARANAEGIPTVIADLGAGPVGVLPLADGAELIWSGADLFGSDVSTGHPIGEHAGFWAQVTDADGFAYEPVSFPRYPERDAPNYGRDSADLVAWLALVVADDRRRAEESAAYRARRSGALVAA